MESTEREAQDMLQTSLYWTACQLLDPVFSSYKINVKINNFIYFPLWDIYRFLENPRSNAFEWGSKDISKLHGIHRTN